MNEVLQLALRPKTFAETVGQREITRAIQEQMASQRIPRAWMFVGAPGGGKTTLARIMAKALQCAHQEKFGNPCPACQNISWSTVEVNASDINGIDEIRQVANTSLYKPHPPSRYRVFILDEAQRLSSASQSLLLKPFEDCPPTTVWFICTTDPQKISPALRRRCNSYNVKPLGPVGLEKLIRRAATAIRFTKPIEDFMEQANIFGITSPGVALQAFEKYVAGTTAKEAISAGDGLAVVSLRICQAMVKGNWETIKTELKRATPEDSRMIRGALVGYLRTVMLTSNGKQAASAGAAIEDLTQIGPQEENLWLPWLMAVTMRNSKRFL